MKHLCIIIALAFFSLISNQLFSQTTFTGANSTVWADAGNWDNGLPATGNDATIPSGLTVEINYFLIVEYNIINNGTINNLFGGTLYHVGTIDNNGTINNLSGGTIYQAGTINNNDFGTINNNGILGSYVFFNNYGTINNNDSGTMTNDGVLFNDGIIDNNGTINNNVGTIDNLGTIYNCFGAYIGFLPNVNPLEETTCPSEEICDGLDNDLDGDVDEVCGCTDVLACNFDPSYEIDDGSCIYVCSGCMNPAACNYFPPATTDDGSCILPDGCTNPAACNYDAAKLCDDGSCTYPGCIDNTACNYNATAGCDDGSCAFPGCTDPLADCNYDPTAGCDDGSCEYLNSCGACTGNLYTQEYLSGDFTNSSDPVNIDLSAYAGSNLTLEFQTIVPECYTGPGDLSLTGIDMNGSCLPPAFNYTETGDNGGFWDWFGCEAWFYSALGGCPDVPGIPYVQTLTVDIQVPTGQPNQLSFVMNAIVDNFGTESRFFYITATNCSTLIEGCDDPTACNYDSLVDFNDGSCLYGNTGCTDPVACNYDSTAGCDDASCNYGGCMSPIACNYDPLALCDDGSCDYATCAGCMSTVACNYNPAATIEDGSCEYVSCAGCMSTIACNYNPSATIEDGSCEYTSCAGCTYAGSPEFDPSATIDDGSCTVSSASCMGDANFDGAVNVLDLVAVSSNFGSVCP